MNHLEKTMDELQKSVIQCNLNNDLYGNRSMEYRVSQVQLNAALDMLVSCGYISDYHFDFVNDDTKRISRLYCDLDDFCVIIDELHILYESR